MLTLLHAIGQNGGDPRPREAFTGKNKEGESMEDPEKALKDSRGGAGLNAIDADKPSETAAGLNKADVEISETKAPHVSILALPILNLN